LVARFWESFATSGERFTRPLLFAIIVLLNLRGPRVRIIRGPSPLGTHTQANSYGKPTSPAAHNTATRKARGLERGIPTDCHGRRRSRYWFFATNTRQLVRSTYLARASGNSPAAAPSLAYCGRDGRRLARRSPQWVFLADHRVTKLGGNVDGSLKINQLRRGGLATRSAFARLRPSADPYMIRSRAFLLHRNDHRPRAMEALVQRRPFGITGRCERSPVCHQPE